MIIREETREDAADIRRLTQQAFEPMPFSSGTEPAIIEALRNEGQLTLSLVAEDEGVIIGQITFSPVTVGGKHGGWFGLGPVSVPPERQGERVGSQLIKRGLDVLKQDGAKGCVLIGDPNYYSRFGFINNTELYYGGLDRQFVQKLSFVLPERNGQLKYCDAFEKAASP